MNLYLIDNYDGGCITAVKGTELEALRKAKDFARAKAQLSGSKAQLTVSRVQPDSMDVVYSKKLVYIVSHTVTGEGSEEETVRV